MRGPVAAALLVLAPSLGAQTTVDPADKHAWQENTGWLNWADADGGLAGVRVLPTHLEGFVWGENIGYISVGSAPGPYPEPALQTGAAFGVNLDPVTGECSGYAWSENCGWINFGTSPSLGPAQGARFDFVAQRFRGYAWAENIGWVNLDDATRFVGADVAAGCPGDIDGDGATLLSDFGILSGNFGQSVPPNTGGDFNGDGQVLLDDFGVLASDFGCTP